MNYVIVSITNENDILEADLSASDDGLHASDPSYHLLLGPTLDRDIVLTPAEALKRIGFAVADQLKDTEQMIRREAEGARSLLMGLNDGGRVVLRFDIAVPKVDAVNALIDGGLARQKTTDDQSAG